MLTVLALLMTQVGQAEDQLTVQDVGDIVEAVLEWMVPRDPEAPEARLAQLPLYLGAQRTVSAFREELAPALPDSLVGIARPHAIFRQDATTGPSSFVLVAVLSARRTDVQGEYLLTAARWQMASIPQGERTNPNWPSTFRGSGLEADYVVGRDSDGSWAILRRASALRIVN